MTVASGAPAPAPYTGNEESVAQACLDLGDAFARADGAMDAANVALDAGVSAAAATRDQACQRPRRPITCVIARVQFRVTVAQAARDASRGGVRLPQRAARPRALRSG